MKTNKGKFLLRLLIIITSIAIIVYFIEIALGNIPLAHAAGLTYIDDIFICLSLIAIIYLLAETK